ncbi:hypothetical protein JIN85_14650 [Luteolibacter pohnpeiensis]|uniref:Uncharacterized protein n=1 Tax=Luteolibacter pohnpeiensis TaxID=454153 RepID=A0A934VXB8_9BACT|nr:hypothetical protein [Luteolibacter pohnpeiensis]MBK1883658.1 hypothetical protein [Luteolibacter pohnpeiensis]
MPVETVIRLEDLPSFIEEIIMKINDGCAAAVERGVQVELPAEITITATIIKDWQLLDIVSNQEMNGNEEQGGGSEEVADSTESGIQTRNGSTTQDESGTTKSNSTVNAKEIGNRSGEEKRAAEEAQSATTEGNRTDERVRETNNAHNQKGQIIYNS